MVMTDGGKCPFGATECVCGGEFALVQTWRNIHMVEAARVCLDFVSIV